MRVGNPAQRKAGKGIDERKRDPLKQADLGVGDMQVGFNRIDEQTEDQPVGVGEDGSEEKDNHHPDGATAPWPAADRLQPRCGKINAAHGAAQGRIGKIAPLGWAALRMTVQRSGLPSE